MLQIYIKKTINKKVLQEKVSKGCKIFGFCFSLFYFFVKISMMQSFPQMVCFYRSHMNIISII